MSAFSDTRAASLRHQAKVRKGPPPEPSFGHTRLTPPCRCGYPMMPSDQGVCPRCSAGVHWTAPAIKGGT